LSGDVPQQKRQALLGRFQRSEVAVLVATDVAARGLHIPDVSHVFNYDLPQDSEDYVHRIGRTARFGASGDAISFACERYAISLPDIETFIGQRIPVEPITNELLADVAPLRMSRPRDAGDRGKPRSAGPGRTGSGARSGSGTRSGAAGTHSRVARPARQPSAPTEATDTPPAPSASTPTEG